MANTLNNQESVFIDGSNMYGDRTRSVPSPKKNIGVDNTNEFYDALIDGIEE